MDIHPSSVSWEDYEALVRELEDEKIVHGQTRSQLMETQDKLAFALGEIEVLRKQIEREKLQFDKTFGAMKNKVIKEASKSVELENECQTIKEHCEQQDNVLSSRDQQIAELTQRLTRAQREYDQQLQEVSINMQQEAYIAKLLLDRDGHSKRTGGGTARKSQGVTGGGGSTARNSHGTLTTGQGLQGTATRHGLNIQTASRR